MSVEAGGGPIDAGVNTTGGDINPAASAAPEGPSLADTAPASPGGGSEAGSPGTIDAPPAPEMMDKPSISDGPKSPAKAPRAPSPRGPRAAAPLPILVDHPKLGDSPNAHKGSPKASSAPVRVAERDPAAAAIEAMVSKAQAAAAEQKDNSASPVQANEKAKDNTSGADISKGEAAESSTGGHEIYPAGALPSGEAQEKTGGKDTSGLSEKYTSIMETGHARSDISGNEGSLRTSDTHLTREALGQGKNLLITTSTDVGADGTVVEEIRLTEDTPEPGKPTQELRVLHYEGGYIVLATVPGPDGKPTTQVTDDPEAVDDALLAIQNALDKQGEYNAQHNGGNTPPPGDRHGENEEERNADTRDGDWDMVHTRGNEIVRFSEGTASELTVIERAMELFPPKSPKELEPPDPVQDSLKKALAALKEPERIAAELEKAGEIKEVEPKDRDEEPKTPEMRERERERGVKGKLKKGLAEVEKTINGLEKRTEETIKKGLEEADPETIAQYNNNFIYYYLKEPDPEKRAEMLDKYREITPPGAQVDPTVITPDDPLDKQEAAGKDLVKLKEIEMRGVKPFVFPGLTGLGGPQEAEAGATAPPDTGVPLTDEDMKGLQRITQRALQQTPAQEPAQGDVRAIDNTVGTPGGNTGNGGIATADDTPETPLWETLANGVATDTKPAALPAPEPPAGDGTPQPADTATSPDRTGTPGNPFMERTLTELAQIGAKAKGETSKDNAQPKTNNQAPGSRVFEDIEKRSKEQNATAREKMQQSATKERDLLKYGRAMKNVVGTLTEKVRSGRAEKRDVQILDILSRKTMDALLEEALDPTQRTMVEDARREAQAGRTERGKAQQSAFNLWVSVQAPADEALGILNETTERVQRRAEGTPTKGDAKAVRDQRDRLVAIYNAEMKVKWNQQTHPNGQSTNGQGTPEQTGGGNGGWNTPPEDSVDGGGGGQGRGPSRSGRTVRTTGIVTAAGLRASARGAAWLILNRLAMHEARGERNAVLRKERMLAKKEAALKIRIKLEEQAHPWMSALGLNTRLETLKLNLALTKIQLAGIPDELAQAKDSIKDHSLPRTAVKAAVIGLLGEI